MTFIPYITHKVLDYLAETAIPNREKEIYSLQKTGKVLNENDTVKS